MNNPELPENHTGVPHAHSVRDELAHSDHGPAVEGRLFVFVPFHPVFEVNQLLNEGPLEKLQNGEATRELVGRGRFEEAVLQMREDPSSLVNWWDKQYREGMALIHSQLEPDEQKLFAAKIPQVVVMGDCWSETAQNLRSANQNDTLYVVGHANNNMPWLTSFAEASSPGHCMIMPGNLLDRMEMQGIPPAIGKLKIFACHGAGGTHCFVPQLVSESRQRKKYDQAQITGYTESVSFARDRFDDLQKKLDRMDRMGNKLIHYAGELNEHLKEDAKVSDDRLSLEDLSPAITSEMLTDPGQHATAAKRLEKIRAFVQRALNKQEAHHAQHVRPLLDQRAGMKVFDQIGLGTTKVRQRASSCAVDYAPGSLVGVPRQPKTAASLSH